MDRPEVCRSAAATPSALSWATRAVAEDAFSERAEAAEAALVCTPRVMVSRSGGPWALPSPWAVTVGVPEGQVEVDDEVLPAASAWLAPQPASPAAARAPASTTRAGRLRWAEPPGFERCGFENLGMTSPPLLVPTTHEDAAGLPGACQPGGGPVSFRGRCPGRTPRGWPGGGRSRPGRGDRPPGGRRCRSGSSGGRSWR